MKTELTKSIESIAEKLELLESELLLKTEEARKGVEEHRHYLLEALHNLPEHLQGLEVELSDDWHALKQNLDELRLQLALAQMESEDAYREQRVAIMKSLHEMEGTMRRIEAVEESEGFLHYKNFVKEARRLEDKLGALHIHFSLDRAHSGEALEQERKILKKKVKELGKKVKELKKPATRELIELKNAVETSSALFWGYLKEFMLFIETDDEQRKRELMEAKVID